MVIPDRETIHPLLEGAWSVASLPALAALPSAVIVADSHGRIVFANALADVLLGRVRLGADVDDYSCMHGLFTMEGRPYPAWDLPLSRAVLRREVTRHVLLKVRRCDGDSTLISVSGQPLFDEEDEHVGGVVIFDEYAAAAREAEVRATPWE
jgi:PAS domain-containing protein